MSTVPLLGSSSPDAMRSSVDFPQPEGPTTVTNSPAPTENDASSIAFVPSGYVIPIASNVMPSFFAVGRSVVAVSRMPCVVLSMHAERTPRPCVCAC
ncbi:MAG: hypothetical protein WKF58_07740 [Ilumatobacteraceae bacterium]